MSVTATKLERVYIYVVPIEADAQNFKKLLKTFSPFADSCSFKDVCVSAPKLDLKSKVNAVYKTTSELTV